MATFTDPKAPVSEWASISPQNLLSALSSLYWESVTRELGACILSLQHLRGLPPLPEEEDITKRMASGAALFAAAWSPYELNEDEATAVWECSLADIAERQQKELHYRRARMVLAGLGLLDVRRLVEFREAPLKSLEGKVQVNIVKIPAATGEPKILVHTLACCECRRPIRTHFFSCNEGCLHHSKEEQSFCSFAKHQYCVCVHCYRASLHAKQHLQKVRPYDPLADNIIEGMDHASIRRLAGDVERLQDHEDKKETKKDGQEMLRTLLHTVPEMARKRMLPFGNVHASLTFGPLVFEIGEPHSQGGALISHRQTPDLAYSETWSFIDGEMTTPAVAVSPDRRVFTSVRKLNPRPVHAVTAQVMGGLFSGHNPDWRAAEHQIVEALLAESVQYREIPGKSRGYNERRLREAATRITALIKETISGEEAAYLGHFARRLTEPQINLRVDRLKVMSNCQTFCRDLLHGFGELFGTVLSKPGRLHLADSRIPPQYMLSFASDRVGSMYDSQVFHTTPSAAYFSEFHTGEDIAEYFDTWPQIPKANMCATLLCWPCMNEIACSMAQHMWQMPHETTSMVAFHLLRDRAMYRHPYLTTDPKENETPLLTDIQWFQNRLHVLIALDTFLVSAGAIIASYHMLADEGADHRTPRPWSPPSAAKAGSLILPGNKDEGTLNFTIENIRRSMLHSWFSKDRRLKKYLNKNAR